jgi:uncharacterized protein (TIRG00374 family)
MKPIQEKNKKGANKRSFRSGRWIGIAISLLFLYLAFRGLNLRDFWTALKGVNILWLLLGTGVYLTSYLFRGLRWHLMLRNIKAVPIWRMVKFVIIGFMSNNLLPARLGEFARALVISNKEDISARSSFASVVLERVFDGVTIVSFLLILVVIQPFPYWVKHMGVLAAGLFLLCFLILILLGHKGENWCQSIQKRLKAGFLCKLAEFMLKFVQGLHMLKSKSLILAVLILSLVIWGIEVAYYLILMDSFDMGLTLQAAAFTLVVANLGIMIPSSPGNLGTMQYFIILGLSIYKVGKDLALVYALTLHGMMYVTVTGLGIIFLSEMGLSLENIKISGRNAKNIAQEKV